jgi:hypothetical protein
MHALNRKSALVVSLDRARVALTFRSPTGDRTHSKPAGGERARALMARNVALPDGNDRFASTAVVTRLRAFETQVNRATD